MTPRVSVIIPNFKNAQLVAETIETLIRQTMSAWELIVVDDGSDSALPEMIEGYGNRYASWTTSLVIVSNKPSGNPSLVKSGIRHMNGDYFAWLNPGELLEPEKLGVQVRFLDENPRAGLVHTACISIDAHGDESGEYHPPDGGPDAFVRLLEGDYINPNTALVRRSILDQICPFVETDTTFPELWRATAYRHALKIAVRSEIGHIDRVLQRSRCWCPDMEYSRLSLGSSLERAFVADCFEEDAVTPTPEIVAALGRRGLMGIATQAFRALAVGDQARALDLVNNSGIDGTWFARHSVRWWSPAFSTVIAPTASREWRMIQEECEDLSGANATGPKGAAAVMESVTLLPRNTVWRLAPSERAIGVHTDTAPTDNALRLDHVVAGDFDGEGREDLLGQHLESGDWWRIRFDDTRERQSNGTVGLEPGSNNLGTVQLQVDARVEEILIERGDGNARGNLTIEKVPKVPDGALKQHLLIEIEGLGEALGTDRLLAARMLLDWASTAANFAVGSRIATETNQFVGTASAAELYYEQFLPNKGAVFCGGMAVFYDRVLKIFGYDSFTINFGDLRDDLNHVATNVPIWDSATWKHYLFDPTFNTTFHDRGSGCQLDFFELVDALDTDTLDHIEVTSRSVQGRDWVSIGALKEPFFGLKEVIGDRYVYGRSDGRLTDYLERFKRNFAANGYDPGLRGFVQLMRARMFSHGPCEFRPATDDFSNKLKVRGIPFGPP